jgi:hypothetical protein
MKVFGAGLSNPTAKKKLMTVPPATDFYRRSVTKQIGWLTRTFSLPPKKYLSRRLNPIMGKRRPLH